MCNNPSQNPESKVDRLMVDGFERCVASVVWQYVLKKPLRNFPKDPEFLLQTIISGQVEIEFSVLGVEWPDFLTDRKSVV